METHQGSHFAMETDAPDPGYYSASTTLSQPTDQSLGLNSLTLSDPEVEDDKSGEFVKHGCQVQLTHFPYACAQPFTWAAKSATSDSLSRDGEGQDCVDGCFAGDAITDKVFRHAVEIPEEIDTPTYVRAESEPEVDFHPEVQKYAPNPDVTLLDQNLEGDSLLHLSLIYTLKNLFYDVIRLASVDELEVMLHMQNDLHQTPLHLAVLTAQTRLVRILTALGSPLGARDKTGSTALHLAARTGDLKALKALTSPITDKERLKIKYLLNQEVIHNLSIKDPDVYNYEGETALQVAAYQGHLHIVQYLLDHVSCDVNCGDGKSGRTVLHLAVEAENTRLLNFLITKRFKYRLDLDAQTYEGHTAMKLAYCRGLASLTSSLILLGADAALVQSDGEEQCT